MNKQQVTPRKGRREIEEPCGERAIDRLKIFAQYAKEELKMVKGVSSFEAYCGLSNNYINNMARGGKGKGNISSDIIARVSKAFPMLNLRWLCTGKGEMIERIPDLEIKLETIKKILS